MGLWLLYLLWWLSVTQNDDKTQKVSEKMSDPERWQATGRIVVSGFHEGGKGGDLRVSLSGGRCVVFSGGGEL